MSISNNVYHKKTQTVRIFHAVNYDVTVQIASPTLLLALSQVYLIMQIHCQMHNEIPESEFVVYEWGQSLWLDASIMCSTTK